MSALARTLTRITVGLTALFSTGLGTAAFAAVPAPDPTGVSDGGAAAEQPWAQLTQATPVQHSAPASVSGVSTLTVLVLIAAAIVLAVVATEAVHRARRHGPTRAVAA